MPISGANQSATSVTLTGDTRIDALLSESKWGLGAPGTGVSLTYSFPSSRAWFSADYGYGETASWSALNGTQIAAVRSALGAWASVANIRLTAVTEAGTQVGDVRAAATGTMGDRVLAWAYLPGSTTEAGDLWLNSSATSNTNPVYGGPGYTTLVHEVGHSLGMGHPFDGAATLPAAQDNFFYTVMAYDNTSGITPVTPMPYDILAVQHLYGANTATGAGHDVYRLSENGLARTIWDSGGSDFLDASRLANTVSINLQDGQYSWAGNRSVTAIAYNTTIESASGGLGADTILGNATTNYLRGGPGGDRIASRAGADTLVGNQGDDSLSGEQGADLIYAGQGDDSVHGGSGNDSILGNLGDDLIFGATGADSLVGGAGADTLIGNTDADRLAGEQGNDMLHGGRGDDWLYGGLGDDTLAGNLGDDVIVGGAGENLLIGGAGADVFYADANDVIQDRQSIDTVIDLVVT